MWFILWSLSFPKAIVPVPKQKPRFLDNSAMKKYRIRNNTLITISENYPATLRIATICFVHFHNDQILMKIRGRKVETIRSNKKKKKRNSSKNGKRLHVEIIFPTVHLCKGNMKKTKVNRKELPVSALLLRSHIILHEKILFFPSSTKWV